MGRFTDTTAKGRLLAAAEALFVERGLDGAKVEDITARATLSKGSFYIHFDSKEAAFREVVEGIVATMAVYVEAALEEDGDEGGAAGPVSGLASRASGDVTHRYPLEARALAARFEARIAREAVLFEYLWETRAHIRLLLEGGKCAAFGYLMDEFADRARQSAAKLLARGVEEGIYRGDFDVEVASLYLAGAYDRLARHVVRQEARPDFTGMLRLMQDLVLRGLATFGANEAIAATSDARVRAFAAGAHL